MNKNISPPKLPLRFFRWYCHPDYREDIEGDLLERFEKNAEEKGIGAAKWGFFRDVIRLCRPGIIRSRHNHQSIFYTELVFNHFKMAVRHLIRHKTFSSISILGLAVAVAACFFIVYYISFELSYDQYHANKQEIYRIICYPTKDKQTTSARTYSALGPFLKENFPEVKNTVRFWRMWNSNMGVPLKYKDKIFYEIDIIKAEKAFFEVFPSLLIRGDPKTVLQGKNSIVLSEKKARKYFGDEDPLGKVITDGEMNFTVSGISKTVPQNSHFNVDVILPLDTEHWNAENHYGWEDFYLYTYLTMNTGQNLSLFEHKLSKAVQRFNKEFPHLKNVSFELQPITEIHLHSDLTRELKPNSQSYVVYSLAAIAFLVICIAWINHINLSSARLISRTREISIRKIIGGGKGQLTGQFLVNYLVINMIAMGLASLFVLLFLRSFESITGVPISDFEFPSARVWYLAGVLFVFGTLATGIYPLLLLPGIKPVIALRGKYKSSKLGVLFRKSLVVFQFVTSIILIAGVSLLFRQLTLMRSLNKNMDIEKIVTVRNPTLYSDFEKEEHLIHNFRAFKNRLLSQHAISGLAASSSIPGSPVGFSYLNHIKRSRNDAYNATRFKIIFIDYDFMELYGIHLLAGRNYSPEHTTDLQQKSIILSESAIKNLGFTSAGEAVRQEIDFMLFDEWAKYEIVGVFKDYHHESVKEGMYPTILFLNEYQDEFMQQAFYSFKIRPDSRVEQAIDHLQTIWLDIWPEKPLDYYFLDRHYNEQYKAELALGKIFTFFSVIAVFIACLGILGMTLFEVQLRAKEISIRKVLGSTITGLVNLFSKQYIQLFILAIIISIPVIIIVAREWLSNYPVHIGLDGWTFLPAFFIVFLVIIIASGIQIYRSAITNPIENLQDD